MEGNSGNERRRSDSSASNNSGLDSSVEVAAAAIDLPATRRKGCDLTDSQSTGACSSAQEASETEFGLSISPSNQDQAPIHAAIAGTLANFSCDVTHRAVELTTSGISTASMKPLSRHLSVSSLSACETDSTCTGTGPSTTTGTGTAYDSRAPSIAMSRTTSLPLLAAPAGDIPSIDPHVIKDLETHARRIAFSVTQLLNHVRGAMHKISSVTASGLQVYEEAVVRTCGTVDRCIRDMYAAMACCDKVALEMTRVSALHAQLREISRQLDTLEAICGVKPLPAAQPAVTPTRPAK